MAAGYSNDPDQGKPRKNIEAPPTKQHLSWASLSRTVACEFMAGEKKPTLNRRSVKSL
jgi:hypothetical protein